MILFQAVSGLMGGTGRVLDPTGASLGLPTDWLAGSPFGSYLIPGIILFTVLGLYPVAAWFCHLPALDRGVAGRSFGRRRPYHLDGVDIAIIGYQPQPPLQLTYGLLGLAILALALSPSIRDDLRPEGPARRSGGSRRSSTS